MRSLRQKIILGYAVFAILLIGLFVLYFLESRLIEKQIRAGSSIAEFFDVALEIRRFEKNYFLYRQAGDLRENMKYVERARQLLDDNGEAFKNLAAPTRLSDLRHALIGYANAMSSHARSSGELDAQIIRNLGLGIVNTAQNLADAERAMLQANLKRQRAFLLITLLGLLVLLAVSGAVVSSSIVRPLKKMEGYVTVNY